LADETNGEDNMAQAVDLIRHPRTNGAAVAALEDAEAIRNLKARYAALCDNQYDADGEAPGVVVVPVPIRAEFSVASDRARVR
jgi:hypothetical protein